MNICFKDTCNSLPPFVKSRVNYIFNTVVWEGELLANISTSQCNQTCLFFGRILEFPFLFSALMHLKNIFLLVNQPGWNMNPTALFSLPE